MGNVYFESTHRHVTPQINCLRKTSSALRFSTHIYGIAKEIDGKTFIFQVNLACDPSNQSSESPVLRVSTHIYGISKEIDGKMLIFQVNLGM